MAKVLLVEDNPVNQRVARRLLESSAHEVWVAGNGIEAVRLASEMSFDLILMDLHMPQMNGADATAEIRRLQARDKAQTPIWALTAAVSDADRQRCLEVGMNGFLTKPIDMGQLMEVIESVVDRPPEYEAPIPGS